MAAKARKRRSPGEGSVWPYRTKAGQLRYAQAGGNTFVMGDVNGDAVADFTIQVAGTLFLSSGDFVL